jgi:uncharacterized protein YxjI
MGLRDRAGGGGGRLGGSGPRRGDSAVLRYQMREKLFSIGDDAWIEDSNGNRAFKVDGKALRVRSTFVLEDAAGNEVASIQEKMLRIKDTMEIERGGRTVATVKKALISPLRDRFDVTIEGASDWDVQGNIVDHEYEIKSGRDKVAEVSKKWFRVRDTYGVEIEPGQDAGLVLAVTVAIDEMRRGQ